MTPDSGSERFEPRAARAMASMFDSVSGRYDLLNRLMTLGQDDAWRRAMWREVPERARVVLDLCTGNGVSLPGLRRPGRTLLGVDVSLGMLEAAADEHFGPGWAPRLACADAFHLPLGRGSVDAVTIAFGMRNLRPRADALAELARVLAPGGTLVVLEATAPRPGPLAPLHRAHLEHGVPALGRLSGDPSAYRYLGQSILEFGDGEAFERAARERGFTLVRRRRFLLGATALWTLRAPDAAPGVGGGIRPERMESVQSARTGGSESGQLPHPDAARGSEARTWARVQAVLSAVLTAALVWALVVYAKFNAELPLSDAGKLAGWVLIVAGIVGFGARTIALAGSFFDDSR